MSVPPVTPMKEEQPSSSEKPISSGASRLPAKERKRKNPKFYQRPNTMQSLQERSVSRASLLPPNSLSMLGVKPSFRAPSVASQNGREAPVNADDTGDAKDSDDSGLGDTIDADIVSQAATKPTLKKRNSSINDEIDTNIQKEHVHSSVTSLGTAHIESSSKNKFNEHRMNISRESSENEDVFDNTEKQISKSSSIYPTIDANARGQIISAQATKLALPDRRGSVLSEGSQSSSERSASSVVDNIERMQHYRERKEKELKHQQPYVFAYLSH